MLVRPSRRLSGARVPRAGAGERCPHAVAKELLAAWPAAADSATLTDADCDLIDGLFAYDTGSRGSGIYDPAARSRIAARLAALTTAELASVGVRLYGKSPYTQEDVARFLEWTAVDLGVRPKGEA